MPGLVDVNTDREQGGLQASITIDRQTASRLGVRMQDIDSALDVAESVWRSVWGLREPQQQAKMFRLVSYRELWAPIGSYNFRVYVRNDLLQTWDDLRY